MHEQIFAFHTTETPYKFATKKLNKILAKYLVSKHESSQKSQISLNQHKSNDASNIIYLAKSKQVTTINQNLHLAEKLASIKRAVNY